MTRAVVRPVLTAACLVTAYYAAPLDRGFTTATAFVLGASLVALGGVIAWYARSIIRAQHPRLRAVEALGMSLPVFLLLFSLAYRLMDQGTPGAFSERLSRTDALYFTVTVFSSVGFGDITPRTEAARVLTMVQMLGNLLIFGLAARILLNAVRQGLDRRTRDRAGGPGPPPP
ncbi:potassium channel family protein [Actinomadura fibrosa]|uniref:Potassium channel family protein n=1 Tax=Actinomadura fibrosa TaxID=111802 RepID=A0ABW2XTD0_9ACTN|nr:potassium channel family protein [Actinomadura fibrosa]